MCCDDVGGCRKKSQGVHLLGPDPGDGRVGMRQDTAYNSGGKLKGRRKSKVKRKSIKGLKNTHNLGDCSERQEHQSCGDGEQQRSSLGRTKDGVHFANKRKSYLNRTLHDGNTVLCRRSKKAPGQRTRPRRTLKSSGRSPGAGWL